MLKGDNVLVYVDADHCKAACIPGNISQATIFSVLYILSILVVCSLLGTWTTVSFGNICGHPYGSLCSYAHFLQ